LFSFKLNFSLQKKKFLWSNYQEPARVVKGLDLGELMKDVGLDLEGFEDPASNQLISNVMETSQDGQVRNSQILVGLE
jgi:hypothetical protein